ncbi:hypothetical protein CAPTEDRAFT_171252 [Capitella teleta]|uniref:Cytochrome P450 n=1 Tax=Capitella teleta TaxID=283909 RepID=R7V533_CAPTE|nr:hypothetical protein CAPTEDRAFT_171252 [Capitella teleta]|eukprot:ELU11466.1 hypothetical protein CAPTEDRAFT_171252 [Capitella teleta]
MACSKLHSLGSWVLDNVPGNKEDARQFAQKHKWELLGLASAGYLAYKVTQLYQLPPGPYGLPVIGYLLRAKGFSDGSEQQKLKQKYGEIASVQLGSDLQIWLNSSKIIKEAFVSRAEEFSFRPAVCFNFFFQFLDVFSSHYDEEWKKSKKFLMSALKNMGFGSSSLEIKVLSEADALISCLEKRQKEAGSEGICLQEPLRWIAANLISQILYSGHYDEDSPELKEIMTMSVDVFNFDLTKMLLLDVLPRWLTNLIFRSDIKELSARPLRMRKFFRKKIDEHEASRSAGEPRDFIDAYLDEKAGPDLDYTKFVDNCFIFFPDSLDTLPLAIEWLVLYLARYGNAQAMLHKELDDIIGRSREPLMKDKASLNYLEACVTETYRLANIFPSLPPHAVERDTRLAGYAIPREATIHGNTTAIHLDPNIFPDPSQFRPERHLDAAGKFKPCEHVIPFGVGEWPRSCVGQVLSKMEVFLVAAKLFQNLQFSFPLDQDDSCLEGILNGLQRRPKDYKLIVKKR